MRTFNARTPNLHALRVDVRAQTDSFRRTRSVVSRVGEEIICPMPSHPRKLQTVTNFFDRPLIIFPGIGTAISKIYLAFEIYRYTCNLSYKEVKYNHMFIVFN